MLTLTLPSQEAEEFPLRSLLAVSKNTTEGVHPQIEQVGNLGGLPVTTSHDACIQIELEKIIGLATEGQVFTLFTIDINLVKLPKGFVKPEFRHYDGTSKPSCLPSKTH